jgi:hypothetical protein
MKIVKVLLSVVILSAISLAFAPAIRTASDRQIWVLAIIATMLILLTSIELVRYLDGK